MHIRGQMNEFSWLPLRLNILPLIHKQAHWLHARFLRTRTQILEGDILALQTLLTLRERIGDRLKHIELFYATNIRDQRAPYLHSVRVVLQQILEGCQEFDKFNVESTEEGGVVFIENREQKDERFKRSPSQSPKSARSRAKSPKNMNKARKVPQSAVSQRLLQLPKALSNKPAGKAPVEQKLGLRLSDLRKPGNKSKTPRKGESGVGLEKAVKGSSRKVEGGQSKRMQEQHQALRMLEEEKQESLGRMRDSEGTISRSMRDLSELVFTIKMTKEEYNEFMRLKRSNNHA